MQYNLDSINKIQNIHKIIINSITNDSSISLVNLYADKM